MLDFKHLTNSYLMRWALAAHDICFTNRFLSNFFALGKSIPIVRGGGVFQVGVPFSPNYSFPLLKIEGELY